MRVKFLKFALMAAACSAAALAAGFGSAALAGNIAVPPHVSMAQAKYYAAHPDEWNAIMARAPTTKTVVPAPAPPKYAPVPPGSWSTLLHTAPATGLGNPLLLTDGTVIVHVLCSPTWYKLKPDENGSYIYGTWTQIANAPWAPLYFASQILNDGRVVGNGGEYDGNQSCTAHWITGGGVYNPNSNTWVALAPPSGWTTIGDAQSIILPNTKYMLADCCTRNQAILNLPTLTFTPTGSGKFDVNDEEGWALLHDNTVLTTDAYVFTGTCGFNTERYNAGTGAWTSAGNATTQLSDCTGNLSFEVGPLLTRPNGTVVAFSGLTTGVAGTSVFNPGTNTWSVGTNLPTIAGQNYNLADAPAAILQSSNIFFAASPGLFSAPTHFFEYSNAGAIVQRADPAGASGNPSYVYNFLNLPNGQVLMTDFTNNVQIYTPFGTFVDAWRPTITSLSSTTLTRGTIYTVSGKQLNGITHGVYGDDQQASTNFPLVQLVNQDTNQVYFARSFSFTNRSIALNSASTASFRMPPAAAMPAGTYSLKVISNAIPSNSTTVTVN